MVRLPRESLQDQPAMPQDVLLCWKSGTLPDRDLELIAQELFRFKYPYIDFGNALCTAEQDECRREAIVIRIKNIAMDRWTLNTAVDRLTDEACQLCYGDRRLGSTIRNQVRDYCDSFVEDLAKLFPKKLFYPREVDANQREIDQEDASNG